MAVHVQPHLVVADADGNIYDDPDLLMVCRKGAEWCLPRPDELMPLPPESELFLLPGRRAVGLNPETGETEVQEDLAVAAFAAPAHTLGAHPAYVSDANAPLLPLFAYGAVGFANGRFYICAKKVDEEQRQVFRNISRGRIEKSVKEMLRQFPKNRLIQHIMHNCVLKYDCPAARNFALGRFEAPLPTSHVCNARCVGCISQQAEDSPIKTTPQCRLGFRPTAEEVVEIMRHHASREKEKPVFSFGQGCEGEPLTEAPLLIEAVRAYRAAGGEGTINCNSNASRPEAVAELAHAGLTSLRVSMNSAREEVYLRYYRPVNYIFAQVKESIMAARERGVFVSINLLYFPGVTDTEEEIAALTNLIGSAGVSFIQLRNLNIDPDMYMELLQGISFGPSVGLHNFRKRLRKQCPWITFGYFNPYLGSKADVPAPMPGQWQPSVPAVDALSASIAEELPETEEQKENSHE
ncbi:MAG: radical SAM protein [Desulfovibrionaceae bacterium]|nr:radical SAM protein [Desulfovibrionaceae bacterium]